MNSSSTNTNPDFLVHWDSHSSHSHENIYCINTKNSASIKSDGKLRRTIATLESENAYIEVSEISWSETTTLALKPNRPGFTLLISTSSDLSVEYGGEPAESSAGLGHILFMAPGKEISGVCTPGSFRTITCSFETPYAENILGPMSSMSEEQLLSCLNVKSSLISSILLRLMQEALHPGPLSTAIVDACAQTMLVEHAHWLSIKEPQSEVRGRLTAYHFAIIDEHIANLCGKAANVSDLASACGLSERYFSKLFREKTGGTVGQYVKSMQIAKAKTYLLETELPLKEIAYRLGFSTPANFSFAFKEATGKTPAQFRKQ